ncbi:MAG: nucleoside-diphosphate sugar epimerase/dehydratase [Planctomycetia bacterium]|nr:nucleoside-diphosphate sugar epimerase/dehydratase [Planctomycetia bacterium]
MKNGNEKSTQKIKRQTLWQLFYYNRFVLYFLTVLIHVVSYLVAYTWAFNLRFDFNISGTSRQVFYGTIGYILVIKIIILYLSHQYRDSWFYSSVKDVQAIIKLCFIELIVLMIVNQFSDFLNNSFLTIYKIPRGILILDFGLSVFILGGLRLMNRLLSERWDSAKTPLEKAFLIGANKNGGYIANIINTKQDSGCKIVGFITLHSYKVRMRIGNIPILGHINDVVSIAKKHNIRQLFVIAGVLPGAEFRDIYNQCRKAGLSLKVIPQVEFQAQEKIPIREIDINDLLKRAPIVLDTKGIQNLIRKKRILITGAGGSIGSEICRQLLKFDPQEMVLLGRGENRIFFLERELQSLKTSTNLIPIIADVSIEHRMHAIFKEYRPQIIFHAAANKHVPLMESNVQEALRVNICGTKIVADAADLFGVEKFIMISTDKAVNPTNVMGASKHLAERYVNAKSTVSRTNYIVTRFGNVLGSNGSVVPIFKQQIQNGGPITITDFRMTRFFMTISEAAQLVLEAAAMGKGGEIFVLDMGQPVKIVDLAKDMIRLAGLPENSIEIREIGLRPGEKLYEELHFDNEIITETKQPKLFASKHREFEYERVLNQFEELSKLFDAPQNTIRQKLLEFIPEYHFVEH